MHGCKFTIWDVGGGAKLRPLWRLYFANSSAIVFIVDSDDRDRIQDAREEMHQFLADDDLRDAPLLVLANKQDLPNVMSTAEVNEKMGVDEISDRPARTFGTCATSGEGVHEAFEWLANVLKAAPNNNKSHPQNNSTLGPGDGNSGATSSTAEPTTELAEEDTTVLKKQKEEEPLLGRWVEVVDEADDEFLEKLRTYKLSSWDHRTHIRIAWVHLTRYGRRKGLPMITEAIRNFIANSDRTNGKTFHETMTYFWIHIVHYAIIATPIPESPTEGEAEGTETLTAFQKFLLLNPQLANGGLFLEYWNKDTMMSPKAKDGVVLPDKKPLPSIVPASSSNNKQKTLAEAQDFKPSLPPQDSEEQFMSAIESGTLGQWGHRTMLRLIWNQCMFWKSMSIANITLDVLKRITKDGFHLTSSYFWIQIVRYAVRCDMEWKQVPADFNKFIEQHKELENNKLWEKYYSSSKFWDSPADVEFVLPDKAPLPNLVPKKK
eukprot:TRINITY_DN64775_c0_g1_i1.p1 TRINITY_DN64775_c0_g1~~TRINITY_DN64775_c0_g1_i1.p1  ORF type:complete len:554 (-),score=86.14 TRINITY_DN64775_c0_g1_i1:132-1601(-)